MNGLTERDNRIVSMSFDNADFQKNMEQSLQSLEDFDKSLNKIDGKSLDSLTKAANNVKLDGISSAALAVQKSFSTMEIVGLTIIQNLTNAVIGFGRSLWANTFGQIKAGGMKRALNIEQASFLLEGLKLDVKQIKEDAMYAVEGTAYGFDEAAKAAAAFGASGVKAGDDMKQALLGVSGVAAMTGRDYQSIADIFTTIASNGKLMTMQLRQFSASGINISATLAKQLNKSEAEINDMVQKGKIDFATFSKAMNEAFGEHAKDANKTFTGSLSNMKAALSRIGEAFATPYIENMIPVFNKLRDVINQVKKDLGPFIHDFELVAKIVSTLFTKSLDRLMNSGKIEKFLLSFRNIITSIALVLNEVGKAFKDVFPNSKGFIEMFYNFTKAIIPSKEALAGFREIFKSIFIVLRIGATLFSNAIKIIASLILYINKWIQKMIGLASKFKEFLDPFIKWMDQTKIVEKTIYSIIGLFSILVDKILVLKDSFNKLAAAKTGTTSFFSDILNNVKNFIRGLWALISQLDTSTLLILSFSIAMIFVIELIRQAFIGGLKVFTGLIYNIIRIVQGIGSTIFAFSNLLKSLRNLVNKMSLSILADIILKVAVSVGILALSMKLLSTINVEGLLKAGGALLFLFGILIGSYAALQKITENDAGFFRLLGISSVLITLSVAIITLTASMKILSTIDSTGLKSGVIGMITITAAIVAISLIAKDIKLKGFVGLGIAFLLLSAALTKIAAFAAINSSALDDAIWKITQLAGLMSAMMILSNYLDKTKGIKAAGFIFFALSIDILTNALTKIAKIAQVDQSSLIGAIGVIMVLTIFIGAMMALSNLLSKTKGIKAAGFIFFALSIDILANAITKIADIARIDQASLLMAVGVVLVLSVLVGAMMALSNLLNNTKGIKAAGFIFFALSIDILTNSIAKIADIARIDQVSLLMAVGVILVLSVLVGAMMALSNLLSKTKGIKAAGFLMFSFCIYLLSQALMNIAKISMQSEDALDNAMFCIVMLTTICILMMGLSTKMKGIKSDGFRRFAASLLVMSIAMNILADAFNGDEGWNNVLKCSAALLAMVGITALMMKISKDSNRIQSRGMFIMASSMLVLSAAVAVLSLIDWKKVLVGAAAIGIMALALGLASRLMKDAKYAQIGFGIMAASMIAIAAAIYILKDIDPVKVIAIGVALSVLTVAMGAIGSIGSKFTLGVLGFLVLSAAIVALSAALKILSDVPTGVLWNTVGVLAVLGVVLGVLSALAGIKFVALGMLVLSVALLALGASCLMVGQSIAVVIDSATNFMTILISLKDVTKEAIMGILENLQLLLEGIVRLSPNIALAVESLANSMAAGLLNSSNTIALAASAMVLAFIEGTMAQLPTILESLKVSLAAIKQWFDANGEEFYDLGYEAGKRMSEGFYHVAAGAAGGWLTMMAEKPLLELTMDKAVEDAARKNAEEYKTTFYDELKKVDNRSQESAEAVVEGLNIGIRQGFISYEEACAKLAEIGLEAFKDKLDIHSPSGEMEENGENVVEGLINGVKNKEGSFSDWMGKLAEKGMEAFKSKFGSYDIFEGMLNSNNVFSNAPSAFDMVEDLSKNGAWESSNHTIHSYVKRWQAEGYESAEAWEAANKEIDPLTQMLEEMAKQMGINTEETEELSQATEDFGDKTTEVNKKLKEFKDGVKNSIAQAMHSIFDEVSEQEYIDPEEMLYRMSENIRRVGEWARNISTLAARGMSEGLLNELKDMGPAGAAKVKAFVEMTDEQLRQANMRWSVAADMPDYGVKEIEKSYREAGYMASLGFKEGIDTTAANDAMGEMSDNALGIVKDKDHFDIESPSKTMEKMGNFVTAGFAIGMTDQVAQQTIRSHIHKLTNIVMDCFKVELKPDIFKSIGNNVINGLNDGIEAKAQAVLAKVRSLASQIATAFARVLAIKSPSRVMAELGEYTMEGLSIGMEDGSSEVEKVTEQTANDILNSMKEQIAAITNGWSEDNVYQPVIRPVFDMEGIQTGYNNIQSWFANAQGLNLSGNLTRLTPTTTDDSSSNQQIIDAINNINNDDVVREINNLRDDISNLQTAMTNIQVVMNTGALVGQLVEPMDRALGSKALIKNRGRY